MTGEIVRRESCHFRRLARGNGGRERGKRELCRKIETITKCEALGSKAEEQKNSLEQTPKRSQKCTRTRDVRNPTRARNGHRAPPCGGDVETGGRRITKNPPPRKTESKTQKKSECPPKKQNSQPGNPDQNTRGQRWPERQLATSRASRFVYVLL